MQISIVPANDRPLFVKAPAMSTRVHVGTSFAPAQWAALWKAIG